MKTLFSVLFGCLAFALMIFLCYFTVSSAVDLVPSGEWAGLIKLGVVILLIAAFGGVGALLSIVVIALASFTGFFIGEVVSGWWHKFQETFLFKYGVKVGAQYKATIKYQTGLIYTVTKIDGTNITLTSTDHVGSFPHDWNIRFLRGQLRNGQLVRIK